MMLETSESDGSDRKDLWEIVCRVFFFKDEERFQSLAIPEADAPKSADAQTIMNLVEEAKISPVKREGLSQSCEDLLSKLGFVLEENQWTASTEHLERLTLERNHHRTAFHSRIAELRYTTFSEEIQRVMRATQRSFGMDMEAGFGAKYEETSEMASEQRDNFSGFVDTFGAVETFHPFFNGLYRALALQKGSAEDQVVCWALDDAALVERGHEFAYAALQLVLGDLRCFVKDFDADASQVVRMIVLDPMLSDRRLGFLLRLFPRYCRENPAPVSGTVKILEGDHGFRRHNKEGELDAPCPQDSMFYPLWTHCDIL